MNYYSISTFFKKVSTNDTTFYMYADSEKEKDEWIGAIGRAIVQSSKTFTNEDGNDEYNSEDDWSMFIY